jgi:hypothetical protein
MMRLKGDQYAATGAGHYFAEPDRIMLLHRACYARATPLSAACCPLCTPAPAPPHYGLPAGPVLHWWVPVYDPAPAHLALDGSCCAHPGWAPPGSILAGVTTSTSAVPRPRNPGRPGPGDPQRDPPGTAQGPAQGRDRGQVLPARHRPVRSRPLRACITAVNRSDTSPNSPSLGETQGDSRGLGRPAGARLTADWSSITGSTPNRSECVGANRRS